jgi:Mrp family chromosome partitioning ATPase
MQARVALDRELRPQPQQRRVWIAASALAGLAIAIVVLPQGRVGKSFVACALAQKACRDGYSVLYMGATALFRDLGIRARMEVYVICCRS